MLTSSSYAPAEVAAARLATYLRLVRDPARPSVGDLAAFHRQHDPVAGAHSIAMSRPDAATRSTIHVSVDRNRVVLAYRSPTNTLTLRLERHQAGQPSAPA